MATRGSRRYRLNIQALKRHVIQIFRDDRYVRDSGGAGRSLGIIDRCQAGHPQFNYEQTEHVYGVDYKNKSVRSANPAYAYAQTPALSTGDHCRFWFRACFYDLHRKAIEDATVLSRR